MTIVPQAALDLIRQFEGFSPMPYRCPAGKATIGYGSTFHYQTDGSPVSMLDEAVSPDEALEILKAHVLRDMQMLTEQFGNSLNANQASALLSFTYNLGMTAFLTSTLYKVICERPSDPYIIDEFLRWNKVRFRGDKIPSLGLTRRRLAEATLYFKPVK